MKGESWDVSLNEEKLEEVKCFRYLGVDLTANGTMEVEVRDRVGKGIEDSGSDEEREEGENIISEQKRVCLKE